MVNFYIGIDKNNKLYAYDEYSIISSKSRDVVAALEVFSGKKVQVIYKGKNLILRNNAYQESITIVNADAVLQNSNMAKVYANIRDNVIQYGFIHEPDDKKIRRRPKKSPHNGMVVKRVCALALGGIMFGSALAYVAKEAIDYKNAKDAVGNLSDDFVSRIAYTTNIEDELKVSDTSETEAAPIIAGKILYIVDEPEVVLDSVDDLAYDTQTEDVESDALPNLEIEKTMESTEDAVTINVSSDNKTVIHLEFPDESNASRAITTKSLYWDLIQKYAHMYGLDPYMVLAIATQEGGIHEPFVNGGGAIGLMQIQYYVWVRDKTTGEYKKNLNLVYYELNEETGVFEKKVINQITDDMVEDLETNIRLGCIICQNYQLLNNYNNTAGLQSYNMGPNAVKSIMKTASQNEGISIDTLRNPENTDWLKYRHLKSGEPKYVEKVNQWADVNEFTNINVLTGEPVTTVYTNDNEESIHR